MTLRTPQGAYSQRTGFGLADVIVLIAVLAIIFGGIALAFAAPSFVAGPAISLAPVALPYYTALSVGRMAAAYIISILFALSYGYAAAHSKVARPGLLPLLDVLQSVPLLSFLPVALLSLTALLPEGVAVELASIFLIFTSMAWNLTFSAYQSFSTVPGDLFETSQSLQLNPLLYFRLVELPFAIRGLIFNSLLSWASGWFFLIAAETFSLGDRDYRLPGLGSYLQAAAQRGDSAAVAWGLVALIATIVTLDQLLWRPALAYAERYRAEGAESEDVTRSWLYELLSRSWLVEQFLAHVWQPLGAAFELAYLRLSRPTRAPRALPRWRPLGLALAVLIVVALGYAVFRSIEFLTRLPAAQWLQIAVGVGATAARVAIAILVGALWAVPVGTVIGTNRRVSSVALPVVQVVASIPATALFPIFVVGLVNEPGGLNLAAVLLMLLATQWYILFNAIAGASSIPRELSDIASTLRLGPRLRWTVLNLPVLYPYLITGLITASGGAWNACIVAEYVIVGGQIYQVLGVGALISASTERGDLVLLFASTLALIAVVVALNRVLWDRLYERAAQRYRLG